MTQEQMAKSFITTFYSKANVLTENSTITLTPNLDHVPNIAEEYKNTLAIKLEKGKDFLGKQISTNSKIYYEKDNDLYFGLNEKIIINIEKNSK